MAPLNRPATTVTHPTPMYRACAELVSRIHQYEARRLTAFTMSFVCGST